jgi:hypothetical protein
MTRIRLPGSKAHHGFMDHGVCTVDDMISQVRAHADHMRRQVAEIDAAKDEDFQVDVVRGSVVQHFVRTLQTSAKKAS